MKIQSNKPEEKEKQAVICGVVLREGFYSGSVEFPAVRCELVKPCKTHENICGRCSKPKKHQEFTEQCHCGRESKYTEYILKAARAYVESREDEYENDLSALSKKGTEIFKRRLISRIPSIERMAYTLNINKETFYEWEKIYPEFSDVMKDLRDKQAAMLIENGLSGVYNSTISKLILTKHGYRDSIESTVRTVPISESDRKLSDEAIEEFASGKKKNG